MRVTAAATVLAAAGFLLVGCTLALENVTTMEATTTTPTTTTTPPIPRPLIATESGTLQLRAYDVVFSDIDLQVTVVGGPGWAKRGGGRSYCLPRCHASRLSAVQLQSVRRAYVGASR